MALDQRLLDVLACPKDKGPLYFIADEDCLYNSRLQMRYHVREDIPVMLIDEADVVDKPEHDRLMSKISTQAISPTFSA
jgi:uncharacterized protein